MNLAQAIDPELLRICAPGNGVALRPPAPGAVAARERGYNGPHEVMPEGWRERLLEVLAPKPLKLPEFRAACAEHGLPLPNWALSTLVTEKRVVKSGRRRHQVYGVARARD